MDTPAIIFSRCKGCDPESLRHQTVDKTGAMTTTCRLLLVILACSASVSSQPSLPGFHGDPMHQTGQFGGNLNCVKARTDCACPVTLFPLVGCFHCPCPDGVHMGPNVSPTSLPTTPASPVTSLPVSTTTGQPLSVTSQATSSSTDYCEIAKNLCRKNCPDGYLVDPDDCTFCLCKNDLITG